jgi:hypothetical protein
MPDSIAINTKRSAVGTDNLCPCFPVVVIVTLRLTDKKKIQKHEHLSVKDDLLCSLLHEPTVLMRDVRRARLAVGKGQPTSTTQMVFASNPGNCGDLHPICKRKDSFRNACFRYSSPYFRQITLFP